jgi:hypothetical protein
MAKLRRYNARDERQDFSTRIIDPEESRRAVESTSLQMLQEIMRERPTPIDQTTDGVPDLDNTPRLSSSRQRNFTFYLTADSHLVSVGCETHMRSRPPITPVA